MDASVAWAIGLAIGALMAGVAVATVMRARTSRERAEVSSLRAQLERHRRRSEETRAVQDLILSSMHDGVLLFDATGQTAFANDALERHIGSRPTSSLQLFPAALREAVTEAANDGAMGSLPVEVGTPSRFLQVAVAPAGEDGSVLVVVRDVTEARRVESIRRDFVANASHELKTPAASIQAAAETLRQAAADDPAATAHFASQIEREALRLSRIVADLLDLSRLESGSDITERVPLDALAREEVQRYEDPAHEAGIALDVHTGPAAWVDGSARDLSLLIRNLVDNAIRYTPPGGSITVEVTSDARDRVLTVSDTGVGIPTRDISRIFERFYRVDRARSRETGGTGLGLAIVKHVAENHGGTIEVKSELAQGSSFTVRLPASAAPGAS